MPYHEDKGGLEPVPLVLRTVWTEQPYLSLGKLGLSCRASWPLHFSRKLKIETRLKTPVTPAPYHVYRGTVLITLVRSLAESYYFDFIDLKKKSDIREGREVA